MSAYDRNYYIDPNSAPFADRVSVDGLNSSLPWTYSLPDQQGLSPVYSEEAGTYTLTIAGQGTVILYEEDGTFTFQPVTGYTGHAYFAYEATDGVTTSGADMNFVVGGDTGEIAIGEGANEQRHTTVSALDDGGYLAMWSTKTARATGDIAYTAYCQRYDATGNPVEGEGEICLLDNTTSGEINPRTFSQGAVSLPGSSGFLVAMMDGFNGPAGGNSDFDVVVARYNANGTLDTITIAANDSENEYENENESRPCISVVGDGTEEGKRILITYTTSIKDEQTNTTFSYVRGKFLDANGDNLSAEFTLSQGTASQNSTQALLSDNRFVVAFQEGNNIVACVYPNGWVSGPPAYRETIAAPTGRTLKDCQITALQNGGFVVVWESDISESTDSDIYMRVYEATPEGFTPIGGGDILVNTLNR